MKKSELRELIREQVHKLVSEARISQEAHIIHIITQCGQDAAQNFIDDNKLDSKKLAAYVRQHSNSKEKYDVRDIIAGTGVGAIKGYRERFLKQFKESVIKEAKEYSFTFDYNTDPDDIEYIENLLKKARVNAYAEQGTFDDEMVIKAGDAIELRKAKKAIEDDGFQINESSLNETLIGPFAFTASTPNDELLAMYHGALDGFSNYKTGMRFKKSEYKLAYQTIEKILQKKGVAITEAKINEAIDIHNDESAMKALEDIAVNMTKWKGSEGAHYTDLLEKVIDFLKYGNHRTS